ncbi:MAG TPA: MFS transporter [Ktedonobacteraceae bacterium]|nr:MFS transporter [Ktedonobacteraceae bacterium]
MAVFIAKRVRFVRALQYRSFALLWLGQTISSLGDGAYYTALAWLILILTGSATAMGIVVTASAIPRVVFLLFGGVVADRLPRRLVMLWSDSGRAVLVLLITVLAWMHQLQIWHLVVLSLLFGFVDGFFIPSYQSIPPQLVPKEDLPSANALNELSQHFSQLLGPLLGAACVALVGPASAFGFDGLTFLASALCLVAIRLPVSTLPGGSVEASEVMASPRTAGNTAGELQEVVEGAVPLKPTPRPGVRGVLEDMREGLTYVMSSTWVWVTIVVASLGNIFLVAPLVVAMPKLVHDSYGAGVWLLGTMATASAIGSISAVLIVGQLKQIRWRGIKAYTAMIGAGFALIAMGWPLPQVTEPFVALPANVVLGFGIGFFNVIWFIVLQQMIPSDKLGRVSSIDMMGSLCLTPIGMALGGVVTDRIGPRLVFIGCGVICVACQALALLVRGIRELD